MAILARGSKGAGGMPTAPDGSELTYLDSPTGSENGTAVGQAVGLLDALCLDEGVAAQGQDIPGLAGRASTIEYGVPEVDDGIAELFEPSQPGSGRLGAPSVIVGVAVDEQVGVHRSSFPRAGPMPATARERTASPRMDNPLRWIPSRGMLTHLKHGYDLVERPQVQRCARTCPSGGSPFV